MLREAAGLALGVDPVSIDLDVEDPAIALDELGLDAELVFQRGRQTGGLGQVVSACAVGDGRSHTGIVARFGLSSELRWPNRS